MFRCFVFFSLLPAPLFACDFCSSSAILTPERATCFVEIFDDRLERLKRSGRGFVQVNLDSCAASQEASDTRSTVGTGLNDPADAYAEGANLFLEEGQMACLQHMIAATAGKFDPELLVQLPFKC